MQLNETTIGNKTITQISGEVDLHSSPALREALIARSQKIPGDLLLDLSGVPYMDSSGVGTMVFLKREVERAGRRVVLIGLQSRVRSVFEITHLEKFFTIVDSIEEVDRE